MANIYVYDVPYDNWLKRSSSNLLQKTLSSKNSNHKEACLANLLTGFYKNDFLPKVIFKQIKT